MREFIPDYQNVVDAAYNRQPKRVPLYEHGISHSVMEKITGEKFAHLLQEKDGADAFFKRYAAFFKSNGYDTVTFELCVTSVLIGGGALGAHADPAIKTREDFKRYPWEKIPALYEETFYPYFEALRRAMPENMKAIGGVGNGVFEIVQDLVSYEGLMLLSYDDPSLYADLFTRAGDITETIWRRFIENFGDLFCVLRFGDDLGYKQNTLAPHEHIRRHILPQYKRIVDLVHAAGKPFLLHSCGCIFDVFEDIIGVGIDAKHSNEDVIAPFDVWVERYGDRIGNFGGVDTDWICKGSPATVSQIEEKVRGLYDRFSTGHGGFALGSGNSVPDYADEKKYLAMISALRRARGDFA